jgi:hypothetical protein
MTLPAVDQHIDHSARRWPAVDIVAQKHLDGVLRPNSGEVMVDGGEDVCELVGASMDIADGIDANSIGQSRFARTGEWKGIISWHQLLAEFPSVFYGTHCA